jgi:galactokinase
MGASLVDVDLLQLVRERHRAVYGAAPAGVVASPGRVNLIGEHTDYNDGFVLPLAINRHTLVAFSPRTDRLVRLWSASFSSSTTEVASFDIDTMGTAGAGGARAPIDYARGVWSMLLQHADVLGAQPSSWCGLDLTVVSDLPIGAGLSSSASFELALLRAACATAEATWDASVAARLGKRVENEWIGLQSGIMDQMVCASARAGHALLLDCRDLSTTQVSIPAGLAVVVLDTGKRRELAGSEYNVRRAQCETAAKALGVAALRDVTMAQVEAARSTLDDVVFRRARHVVGENDRTTRAAAALIAGQLDVVGALMRESHASLRDDYEVSCVELDLMADIANAHRFVVGARMTGGGFGGCAVALVDNSEPGRVDAFCTEVEAAYRTRSACTPMVVACLAAEGTHVVEDAL